MVKSIVQVSFVVTVAMFLCMAAYDLEKGENWGCDLPAPILCAEMPVPNTLKQILTDGTNSPMKWLYHFSVDFPFMLAYGTLFAFSPYLSETKGDTFKASIMVITYAAVFLDVLENCSLIIALHNEYPTPSVPDLAIPTSTLESLIYTFATIKFTLLSLSFLLHSLLWCGFTYILIPFCLVGSLTYTHPICAVGPAAAFAILAPYLARKAFSSDKPKTA